MSLPCLPGKWIPQQWIDDELTLADPQELEDLCRTGWWLHGLIGISLVLIKFGGSFHVTCFCMDLPWNLAFTLPLALAVLVGDGGGPLSRAGSARWERCRRWNP